MLGKKKDKRIWKNIYFLNSYVLKGFFLLIHYKVYLLTLWVMIIFIWLVGKLSNAVYIEQRKNISWAWDLWQLCVWIIIG